MSLRIACTWLALAAIAGCGTSGAPDGGVSDGSTIDAARVDAATIDASAIDAGLDTPDAPNDDAPFDDAFADDAAVVDAGSDASTCGFIGAPCDSSMVSAPDCPFGFVCYGGHWADMRATGVCLSAVGPRTDCNATGLCPGAFGGPGTRCYRPYGICLYSYEVPCVCGDPAAASNCGPTS
jgi:hypothetical protein